MRYIRFFYMILMSANCYLLLRLMSLNTWMLCGLADSL